jgi:hypothetical protein
MGLLNLSSVPDHIPHQNLSEGLNVSVMSSSKVASESGDCKASDSVAIWENLVRYFEIGWMRKLNICTEPVKRAKRIDGKLKTIISGYCGICHCASGSDRIATALLDVLPVQDQDEEAV